MVYPQHDTINIKLIIHDKLSLKNFSLEHSDSSKLGRTLHIVSFWSLIALRSLSHSLIFLIMIKCCQCQVIMVQIYLYIFTINLTWTKSAQRFQGLWTC